MRIKRDGNVFMDHLPMVIDALIADRYSNPSAGRMFARFRADEAIQAMHESSISTHRNADIADFRLNSFGQKLQHVLPGLAIGVAPSMFVGRDGIKEDHVRGVHLHHLIKVAGRKCGAPVFQELANLLFVVGRFFQLVRRAHGR